MRLTFALLCSTAACLGAITGVTVTGVTNTQGVISYTAPDSNACKVAVSENTSLSPLANDVDPAKFQNANLDTRNAALVRSTARTFVVGKRMAQIALDKVRYSRALQANTAHYFSITCPSTGDTYRGTFQTANIAMGSTFSEPEPVDPLNPGEYAWPTLSLTDRNQVINDPQTGVQIKRLSLPKDRVITVEHQSFAMARTTGWANPQNALNATDTGAAATVTADNVSVLQLLPQNNGYFGYISFFKGSHGANQIYLNWFQTTVHASINNTSCNTMNMDDCKLVVCLTVNGVSCYNGAQQWEQPLSTTDTAYTFGTRTAIDLWQMAGSRPANGAEVATRLGTVSCDGSTAVSYAGGDFFGPHWTTGSTITINGSDYKISGVINTRALQLQSACPSTNGSAVAYQATNFGVLLRKKTTSADIVSVQASQVNYQTGAFPFWDYTGAYDMCSATPVIGASGNPGFNCATWNGGSIYWVDGVTAEAHLFARNFNPAQSGCGQNDSIIFDSTNPDIFYCGGAQGQQLRYFGNHLEPTGTLQPGSFQESENLPACASFDATTNLPPNQPCIVYSALPGGGVTFATLLSAFDPTFQADRFLSFYLAGVENGLLVLRIWRGGNNSIAWTALFDPYATANKELNNAGCVGGGLPGCVVAAMPSWNRPRARWCTQKANNPLYMPGWMAIGPYLWGDASDTRPGEGPYISTVNDGTALTTTSNTAGGLNPCPSNALGVTGMQCTTITVDGEPRDPSPCTTSAAACGGAVETGLPGELGAAQVGDYFTVGAASPSEEILILLAKGGSNGTTWTFQRGANGNLLSSAANPQLFAFCNSNPQPLRYAVAGGDWYWDYTDDPHGYNTAGGTILGDNYSINAHFYSQNGTMASGYTTDSRCANKWGSECYQTRLFGSIPQMVSTAPAGILQENPTFSGKSSPADPNHVQVHPAGAGLSANASQRNYFFDGRPFNGSNLSGSGSGEGSAPAVLVAGQLWKFTASQLPNLDRKFSATYAFAGQKPLFDVSAPNSLLGSTAADAYKYCVANLSGECVAGSQAGDVYVNAPYISRPYCSSPGQATGLPDEFDLCIGNNAMVFNSILQLGLNGIDMSGAHQRVLTKGLSRSRVTPPFWHVHALPSGNWFFANANYADDVGDQVLAVKVPPVPPNDGVDGIDRSGYLPVIVTVPQADQKIANRVTTATIEFGYEEFGAGADSMFYCSSRQENCEVGPATSPLSIDPVNPYFFSTTEAGKLAGTACRNGCQIGVPGLSQHVIYGRAKYRTNTGKLLAYSPVFVVSVP